MQVLAIIVPYSRTISNLALSCQSLRDWLSNNGFRIKTSQGKLCLKNLSFYRLLGCPDIDEWMAKETFRMIQDDNPNSLKLLLEHKTDLKVKYSFGVTALRLAATASGTECLQLLLQYKADIEVPDLCGRTALMEAVICGTTKHLEILLENKANVEAEDIFGGTALIMAAREDKVDCLRLLLKYGAQVSPEIRICFPEYYKMWGDSTL